MLPYLATAPRGLPNEFLKYMAHGCFQVATLSGAIACGSLVVATGGKSIPKMGASGLAYDIAAQFGIGVVLQGVHTVSAGEKVHPVAPLDPEDITS